MLERESLVSRWQIISVNSCEVSEETDIKVGNSVCVKWFQKDLEEFWTGTVISCLFDKSFIQESADQFEHSPVKRQKCESGTYVIIAALQEMWHHISTKSLPLKTVKSIWHTMSIFFAFQTEFNKLSI